MVEHKTIEVISPFLHDQCLVFLCAIKKSYSQNFLHNCLLFIFIEATAIQYTMPVGPHSFSLRLNPASEFFERGFYSEIS